MRDDERDFRRERSGHERARLALILVRTGLIAWLLALATKTACDRGWSP